MAKYSCPSCGGPLNGNETKCPECGVSIRFEKRQTPTPSSDFSYSDEGDNNAEDILRRWLQWIKVIIIIISILAGAVSVIGGIAAASSYYGSGWQAILGIITGGLIILFGWIFALLVWSVGMVFVNISTNVRSIKKQLQNNN